MITASLVKELRQLSAAPLMDCKKALEESQGDLEKAKLILRKKGKLLADKRADRDTSEGVIAIYLNKEEKKSGIIKLACETDFVAKNEKFQDAASKLAKLASEDDNDLLEKNLDGIKVKEYITDLISEIRENISITQHLHWSWQNNSYVASYVHHNNKIGVLVELSIESELENDLQDLAKDICLHLAANRVECITEQDIKEDVLVKERNFLIEQAKESKKPEAVIEKMVEGRMQKFKKEICLLEQPFLKNPDISIRSLLEQKSSELKQKIVVSRFCKLYF